MPSRPFPASRSFNDGLPKGRVAVGDRIGTATVIAVSGLGGAEREKRAKAEGKPWGRVVSADADRVVLALSIPPGVLWPNGRPNPFVRAKAVREHREESCRTAAAAMERAGVTEGMWGRATLQAAFWWRDLRRRDEDGALASLKSYRDGLVDARLIPDDDTRHLSSLPATFAVDRAEPRVILTIERRAT